MTWFGAVLILLGVTGGRIPSSRVSIPPLRFSVPPSRFEHWMIRRKRASMNKSYKFRPNVVPNCGEKLVSREKHFNCRRRPFFFVLHLILGKKTSIFGEDFFFRSSPNFGEKTKNTSKAAKVSPHAKFYNLSTGLGTTSPWGPPKINF